MKIKLIILSAIILASIFFILNRNVDSYSAFLESEFNKIQKLDKPDLAGFRDFFMTQDPELKRVPSERLFQALKAKKELKLLKSLNAVTWTSTPTNMGGRSRDIMFDPTDINHKKAWACSVTGGLWYNNDITDASSSWVPVSDDWTTMSTTNICYDPNNTSIFYVGTGEAETAIHTYRESSGRGFGIWKTTDAGQTWQQLSSTEDFAYVSDIEVRDEAGLSVIYAGVMSGEYAGAVFQAVPADGLYRSADGGSTWTQVLPNIDGETVPYAPSDIEISDDGKIYVGTTNNLNQAGGACILSSTTGLAGSWTVNTDFQDAIIADFEYNLPGRVELSASKTNPSTVYAIIGAGSNTELMDGFNTEIGKYIVKTTNSGTSWSYVNMPPDEGKNWAYLSWHAFTVQVSPTNENMVFVGGLDVHKSTDGGSSWTKISDWVQMYYGGGDDYVHGDIHQITYNPNITSDYAIATDGGIFYSNSMNNSSIVFEPRNNSYNTFQFYTCALAQEAGVNMYTGGLQDNGTFLYTDDHPYDINDMIQGGDGAYTMWDKNDPNSVITSTYNNSILVYYDGGYTYINDYYSGTFVSPYDFDSDDNVIYANAITFYGDYADQIFRVTDLPYSHTDEFIDVNTGTQSPFSAVRFTKTQGGDHILLVGNFTGDIFKITNINGVPSSQQIDNGQLPEAYVSCIQTSQNADTMLVTFSNYGVESVWQTFTGGSTWINISGNLPDMPIRWAIYHPQNKNQVMLATETGIWATVDANAANVVWTPYDFPNVRVDMLDVRESDNYVAAATHGRGMYTATWDYATGMDDNFKKISDNNLLVYPNPATAFINVELAEKQISRVEVYSVSGKLLLKENINNVKKANLNIDNLPTGKYVIRAFDKNGIQCSSVFMKE